MNILYRKFYFIATSRFLLFTAQPYPVDTGKTYFAEFPWMVALLTIQSDGKYLFQCGGSMITNSAILTAAHCVTK